MTAWPVVEATRIAERLSKTDRPAVFETGFGPSGLPHIGTFAEILRTAWVRMAYEQMTGQTSRLIAFSDDLDALRKVPDNLPHADQLTQDLGLPLCHVRDPFGQSASLADHTIQRLESMVAATQLDRIEFTRASQCYRDGTFNPMLRRMLERMDAVTDVILPTLGQDRRATYSPFLPIHPLTKRVMQVPVLEHDVESAQIVWRDDQGVLYTTSILDGHCKAQWKADWALRWATFSVDYEMSGKDLIDSVRLSSQICKVLGALPPVSMTYELLLDAAGQKVSKSRGNGFAMEDWLRYGGAHSLGYFLFATPGRAKAVRPDLVPQAVDDLHAGKNPEARQAVEQALGRVVPTGIEYTTLLTLAGVANTDDKAVLWRMLDASFPIDPARRPAIDHMINQVLQYYQEVGRGTKRPRLPTTVERAALLDLATQLRAMDGQTSIDTIQFWVFEVGKRHPFTPLRAWFQALYEILLGQPSGPRFGAFIQAYGVENTIALIERRLEGDLG